KRSTTSPTILSTCSSDRTSHRRPTTGPWSESSATVRSSSLWPADSYSGFSTNLAPMSLTTTVSPSRSNRSAIARPMPVGRPAPVTNATRPSSATAPPRGAYSSFDGPAERGRCRRPGHVLVHQDVEFTLHDGRHRDLGRRAGGGADSTSAPHDSRGEPQVPVDRQDDV